MPRIRIGVHMLSICWPDKSHHINPEAVASGFLIVQKDGQWG